MSNRNTKLGGTNWADGEVLWSADLNDTYTAYDTYVTNNLNYSLCPVGTIVAYNNGTIPAGWVECNGGTISDAGSVYNGQTAPDLNGTTDADSLFLRGNTTSGGTGGAVNHSHSWAHHHIDNSVNSYREITIIDGPNIPKYYAVKWMMRIK